MLHCFCIDVMAPPLWPVIQLASPGAGDCSKVNSFGVSPDPLCQYMETSGLATRDYVSRDMTD